MKYKSEQDFMGQLEAIHLENDEERNKVACALLGHSKIQNYCFGYFTCARCGEQVGDNLGSIYPEAENIVIMGHNCPTCQENYEKLGWEDKIFVPDPFMEEKAPAGWPSEQGASENNQCQDTTGEGKSQMDKIEMGFFEQIETFTAAAYEACEHKECDKSYEFVCPLCGGRAIAGKASCNGHHHAHCKDCGMSIME